MVARVRPHYLVSLHDERTAVVLDALGVLTIGCSNLSPNGKILRVAQRQCTIARGLGHVKAASGFTLVNHAANDATFCNGRRLDAEAPPLALKDGDKIQFGWANRPVGFVVRAGVPGATLTVWQPGRVVTGSNASRSSADGDALTPRSQTETPVEVQ